jgi:K+/H+ antiporter YhaU regulatory subunit KhtT
VAGVPQVATDRIRLPSNSGLVGKTIAHSGLRTKTGALILSVRRGADDIATPDPTFRLAVNDVLVVVGQPDQLQAAKELLTKPRS